MEKSQINSENWTSSHYSNGKYKALITFGASPDILSDDFIYFVTVLDEDNNEIHQDEFLNLNAASQAINNKYYEFWNFESKNKLQKSGGCSTCIAH